LATGNEYKPEYASKSLVVFARCTPKDKEKIISTIPAKTLAIGDGANDVCMLTRATIGVGINGKEGKAAAQAGDVAIPEFRFLKRLLFYYGCEIYRRNAYLVKYNFYKNFIYALPQLVFGWFSAFSGTSIYDTYLAQLYNLLFTTLPIILLALYDC
jgi:phospholipid-transporting ATPase